MEKLQIIIENQCKKNINKIPKPKNKNNHKLKDVKILMTQLKERKFSEKNMFSKNKLNDQNNISTSTQTNELPMKGILGNPNLKFRPLSNKLISRNIYKTYKTINNRFIPRITLLKQNLKEKQLIINDEETSFDRERNLNDKKYLANYFSKYKQGVSLYSVLEKKKNEFFENIKEKKYYYSADKNKKTKRKIVLGLSQVPNISKKSKELKIPFINKNLVTIHNKNFFNYSSGERYAKHMNGLNKIKQMLSSFRNGNNNITLNRNYSQKLISNYLMENGIYEKKYYKEKYINNFVDFLNLDYDISPDFVFKNCLYEILNGNYNNYLKGNVTNKSTNRVKLKKIKVSKSSNSIIEKNLFFQKYFLTSPMLNDIKEQNFNEYMNIIKNSSNIDYNNKDNYEEAKKRGKLCEFIVFNRLNQFIQLKQYLNTSSS